MIKHDQGTNQGRAAAADPSNEHWARASFDECQALYERRLHDIQEAALARIEAARRNRKQGRMTRAALFTQVGTRHGVFAKLYAKSAI